MALINCPECNQLVSNTANKYANKVHILTILLIVCLLLSSCTNDNEKLKNDFLKYYNESYNKDKDNKFLDTPNNSNLWLLFLERDSNKYHVIMTVHYDWKNGNSESLSDGVYNFITMPIEDKKAELKACGDFFVDYAKDQKLNNNYDLTICLNRIYDEHNYIYDYERDLIYIPNDESLYIEMYERFKTVDPNKLAKSQEGIDFLTSNNRAYIKHDEVEFKHPSCYSIYINNDGEYNEFYKDASTGY